MKNTRKKMLLSSIAMLLVALVALGSATYAWYVANPNATATGLKMKTEAGKGLLVQSESESALTGAKFTHDAILNAQLGDGATDAAKWAARHTKADSINLQPASIIPVVDDAYNAASAFATADAASASSPAKTGNYSPVGSASIGIGKDVYDEWIALKVTGGADSAAVSITQINWTYNDSYDPYKTLRVAVVGTDGEVKAIYSQQHAEGTHVKTISGNVTEALTPTAPIATEQSTASGSLAVGNANKAGTAKIHILAWVDGEDPECYSDNISGADILTSLNIKMKLTENLT